MCGVLRRAFANPSYHVQALFARHQGLAYARTSVDSRSPRNNGVAAAATCQDESCTALSIKVRSLAHCSELLQSI